MTHVIDKSDADMMTRTESLQLRENRWLGTGTEGFGADPLRYPAGNHRRQVELFNKMATDGAAVVAGYPKLGFDYVRVVGVVKCQEIFRHVRLICLRLCESQLFDATASFLGNLQPVKCTLQDCSNRSVEKLALLASRSPIERSVKSMHNRDVEWLSLNYLLMENVCTTIWSGGKAYPHVDHIGWTTNGREVLTQTTVSNDLAIAEQKCARLLELLTPHRDLVFCAPRVVGAACPSTIRFIAIEDAFNALDQTIAGRLMIDRTLSASPLPHEPF